MRDRLQALQGNLNQALVGKPDKVDLILVALLGGGHALLEDVPGVGKTLLAKSLARSIDGKFQRVQCTPDLLPADITGSSIWNPQGGQFEFIPGPAFANVFLADEINRATPRTQSAMLEVMEEHQVTTDGVSRAVPEPFFGIATQNPIEYQGTFPLPEAQMDRFMVSFSLGYPGESEELQMLKQNQGGKPGATLEACITPEEVRQLQKDCSAVRVDETLQSYLLRLVRSTRSDEEVTLGVSPRGAVALQRASQAQAFLQGRDFVSPDDVKALAGSVLSHRLIPAGGKRAETIIQRLLQSVPVES
ncbi:MAG: AAA family ATPase [Cyanophyceae cyanobacterium]